MTENYRYPNIRQSVWILVSFLVLVILLVVPLYFIETVTDFPLLEHPASLTLIQLIVYGLILARGLKRANSLTQRNMSACAGTIVPPVPHGL